MARSRRHPSRWTFKHGAYYYRVPPGQEAAWDGKSWFRLGRTEAAAYRAWYERLGPDSTEDITTVADVIQAYWRDASARLRPATVEAYGYHLVPLRTAFGKMRPETIKPRHVYAYMAERPHVSGNREAAVLSAVLTWATQTGLIDFNPIRGQVRKRAEKPRDRVPEPSELQAFLDTAADEFLRGYCALKRITGMRQGQMLAINLTYQWDGELLRVPGSKGGKDIDYEGKALNLVIGQILGRRLPRGHLFLNQRRRPVTATGFRSKWRRAMEKYEKAGGEWFNEHDVRAMTASEAKTLEHAQALLGHQDSRVTKRVYRRKAERVTVLDPDSE